MKLFAAAALALAAASAAHASPRAPQPAPTEFFECDGVAVPIYNFKLIDDAAHRHVGASFTTDSRGGFKECLARNAPPGGPARPGAGPALFPNTTLRFNGLQFKKAQPEGPHLVRIYIDFSSVVATAPGPNRAPAGPLTPAPVPVVHSPRR